MLALFRPNAGWYRVAVNIHIQSVRATLQRAFTATQERFVRGVPTPPPPPQAVWSNKPRTLDEPDHSPADLKPGERVARPQVWRSALAERALDGGLSALSPASATELELAAAQLTVTGSVSFLLTASAPDTGGAWGDVGKERCPRLPGGALSVLGDPTSEASKYWPTDGPKQPSATSLRRSTWS